MRHSVKRLLNAVVNTNGTIEPPRPPLQGTESDHVLDVPGRAAQQAGQGKILR
jgi:hypothetical protein